MLKTSVMKYSLLLGAIVISMTGYAQAWTKQYDHVDDCVCGLSLVGKSDKHGFVDKNGKLVVPLIYDEAMTFSEGMAAVKQDGKWGYLDSTGKIVIPLKYADAMSFYENLTLSNL